MSNENKNNYISSMDVKDEKGNILGAVCVSPAKELGKRDIILMDEQSGSFSVRSTTELINMLSKKNVPFEERKHVLDFLSERLRFLEQEVTLNTIKTLNDAKKKKK
jgi:hypothetical protein